MHNVIDKRGTDYKEPKEVCRVCGSETVHTRDYGRPTTECIKYLKGIALKDCKNPIKRIYVNTTFNHPLMSNVKKLREMIAKG